MTDSTQLTNRETLDIIIQRTILIYRWAVIASFSLIGAGFLIANVADQGVESEMASPLELVRQALNLEASGFLGLGIGVMVLTPIVMIAAAAVTFFRQNDRRYGFITVSVAAILSLSIALSFVIG